jgi:ABC-type sugar transport system permease subunit
LALACDREIRMKRFYRVVFFIPPVLSEVVVGLIWKWILNPKTQNNQYVGLLNHLLSVSGFSQLVDVHGLLQDPHTVLTTIAIVHCWKGFGWGFIMLLAGLQTIDKQLYEAAKVDGASSWKTFTNVTMPMMLPVIIVVMILTILGSMQVFVLILSLLNQGLAHHADVPVILILQEMSADHQFGYACAEAVIFGMVLVCISFITKKLSDKAKQV